MQKISMLAMMVLPVLLGGCTVGKIVTAPVRAAGTVVETAVDASTQTQSEKEEDEGRRVLAERKQAREACLDEATDKEERRACKRQYPD